MRFGAELVDYPKKDRMYSTSKRDNKKLYGRGFTIWKTLADIPIERNPDAEYRAVVFGNVWRWKGELEKYCDNDIPVHFLDGSDHNRIFEPVLGRGTYYKRERMIDTDEVKPINFSIPSFKIRNIPPKKRKGIVNLIEDKRKYSFSREKDYYDAIGRAKYAITCKKGGWDCMRHYEIAANWTVPCFYNLAAKPATCAPHGLVDMVNVVGYKDEDELFDKINTIENNGLYSEMQYASWQWANDNSCENVSRKLINGS